MRTAQGLKLSAYGVIALGVFAAFRFFSPVSLEFWIMILLSILLCLIVRIFAIMGQLLFEIRNDFSRIFGNIERGLYYSNSLTKEIRDLMDSDRAEKKTHENTSS